MPFRICFYYVVVQNSALGVVKFDLSNNSSTVINDSTRRAFGFYDKTTKTVRIYAQCNFSADNTLANTFAIPKEYRPKSNVACICFSFGREIDASAVRPGQVTPEGYLTGYGSTSVARSVIYIAEYQI